MSQSTMTLVGAEILLLLTDTSRSMSELFALLRYDAGDIHRCITALYREWLVDRTDETVTLTFTGHLLAGKIRAVAGTQHGGKDCSGREEPLSAWSDWVLDPVAREFAVRDLLGRCPWLETLPAQPQVSCGAFPRYQKENATRSGEGSCLGKGDTPLDDLFRTAIVLQRFGFFFMIHAVETHAVETLHPALVDRLNGLHRARLISDMTPISTTSSISIST